MITLVSRIISHQNSALYTSQAKVHTGSAYLLATAAGGPIWCSFSDIFGRKPILLAAMSIFFLSSIICAAARSMAMLIAGKGLEGLANSGLVQLANITISDLFSVRGPRLVFRSFGSHLVGC